MGNCLGTTLKTVQEIAEVLNEQNQQDAQQNQQQQQTGAVPTSSPSGLSPIYPSLPEGAEQHDVRNVYDGDTLTLIDERRVRFLGIDTPEIKEKQPFAEGT